MRREPGDMHGILFQVMIMMMMVMMMIMMVMMMMMMVVMIMIMRIRIMIIITSIDSGIAHCIHNGSINVELSAICSIWL